MPTPAEIVSFNCKHFRKAKFVRKPKCHFQFICKAFPEGIPESILSWEEPHTKVVTGQEGKFVFTSIKG